MKRTFFSTLALAILLSQSTAQAQLTAKDPVTGKEPLPVKKTVVKPQEPAEGETCGSYGTTVDFFDSPGEAAKEALKEQKLVMVLHVSGNFEDPRFT